MSTSHKAHCLILPLSTTRSYQPAPILQTFTIQTLYDPLLPWAVEVAKNFGLTSAAFFTQKLQWIIFIIMYIKIKLPPTQNDEKY
ncbi:hypothetical protein H5410_039609 [Solanum commersonii]|uniref:Uncharacterized protein n=1 Tax=Solanum commersonii TaxID=4109 RepID=A0A9J5XNN0_SOLCO|nr:hypothetical protein H5410_039609 [Solanum commersonii]